jgi:hypothetical protein
MAISSLVHFADLPDPRRAQGRRHCLADMIVLAVCAVICAADSWADVWDFGRAKFKWFKTFLDLPHGIPSQHTFEHVFSRLDPDALERCFIEWTKALSAGSGGHPRPLGNRKPTALRAGCELGRGSMPRPEGPRRGKLQPRPIAQETRPYLQVLPHASRPDGHRRRLAAAPNGPPAHPERRRLFLSQSSPFCVRF